MKIAILGGTGQEARGLVLRLAHSGEEVIIGSRQADKAEQKAAELNQHLPAPGLRGADNQTAAAEADLVILTIPYAGHAAMVSSLAEVLKGKIVIDTTVPLDTNSYRQLARQSEQSAAEEAQQVLGPETRVVSAFQNIAADTLADLSTPFDCDVLVCGNDREAKSVVIGLIGRMGIRALDAGPLKMTRVVEEMTPLLIALNRRYHSTRAGLRITGITP